MRILAIDHGTVRMGVAISDELGLMALPLEFIPADPLAPMLERIKTLIRDKEVSLVLLGLPRNMDGTYGPAALKVQEFAAVLKDVIPVPIKTWDERLTSVQANKMLRQAGIKGKDQRQRVDALPPQSSFRVTLMPCRCGNRCDPFADCSNPKWSKLIY